MLIYPQMDLHQLKIFASVYRNRSFSRASEEIYLSQPTVSDHIKALEEELGCSLFDRLGRSIMPTAEADIIYPKAIDLLERAREIKELVLQTSEGARGDIKIGASTIPGTYLLPRLIATFKAQYPEVRFDVTVSDSTAIYAKVCSLEIHMGLVGAMIEDEALSYEPFFDDELVLVCPNNGSYPDEISPSNLKTIPFVLREAGSGTRKEMEGIFRRAKIGISDLNVISTFGSTEAVKEAVKSGIGCSVLSSLAVKDELGYGLMRKIHIKGLKMNRKFYIVFHKRRTLPKRYELFRDHILRGCMHDGT